MHSFALIKTMDNFESFIQQKHLLKYIPGKFKYILMNKIRIDTMFSSELLKGSSAYIIVLPFMIEDISSIRHKKIMFLCEQVSEFCKKNNVNAVIAEAGLIACSKISNILREKVNIVPELRVKLLKLLSTEVINYMLRQTSGKFENVDITLAFGKERSLMSSVLMHLAPKIKSVTVLCRNEDEIKDELYRVFEETGLPIYTTTDIFLACKDKDFFIYDDENMIRERGVARLKGRTILLNFTSLWIKDISITSCPVINDIKIKIPDKFRGELKRFELSNHKFNINHILFLLMRCNFEIDILNDNYFDSDIANRFAKEFSSQGFAISGLVGRNGIINLRDVCQKYG